MGAGNDGALALVRVDAAREQPQQRRLAGAVAADQREPVARADIDVEFAEQPAAALDQAEAFIRENWCCHDERRSEEHTSELQSLMRNSYAVFCLKNKIRQTTKKTYTLDSSHTS